MKVLYDHQIFEHQVYGGISKYFYQLINSIENRDHEEIEYSLPISYSSNEYIKSIPTVSKNLSGGSEYYKDFLLGFEFPGKWRIFKKWRDIFPDFNKTNQRITISALIKGEYDIFHPTDIDDYFLPHLGRKPFVITVHDMIDEVFPEYGFHVDTNYKTSIKEKLVRNSAGIIAVSETTKKDILHRFDIDEKKIRVIHHGVEERKLNFEFAKKPIPEKFFLYVGKRVHYKNFYFLLQCLQPLLLNDPKLKIVCVGPPFNLLELEYFKDLGISSNLLHENADDLFLSALYQKAIAFVYPSLYEGFGIPILEAYQNGCPVILSNASCFPEVAGEAGLFFNPKEINSVQDAFQKILKNESLRATLIEKGHEREGHFPLKDTIDKTIKFYQEIVQQVHAS